MQKIREEIYFKKYHLVPVTNKYFGTSLDFRSRKNFVWKSQ